MRYEGKRGGGSADSTVLSQPLLGVLRQGQGGTANNAVTGLGAAVAGRQWQGGRASLRSSSRELD